MESTSRDELIDSSCFVATDGYRSVVIWKISFANLNFVLSFIRDKASRNFLTE